MSGLNNQAAVVVKHLSKSYQRGARAPLVPVPSLFRRKRSGAQREEARDDYVEPDDGLEDGLEEPAADEEAEPPHRRDVWVLRDVNFAVAQGTALGIIGPNGSGKSTLLKILGRITPPTEGQAAVRGRVVPMIEVAASFLQPDLPARENVALLARLFGVPPNFATGRLREILEFGDLTEFERARTKTYSSGLLRRLAFSTVLHFEPDILLADDVIGVGDAAFRERCLASIAQRRTRGLTLLFATHDLDLLRHTCDEALWLDSGRVHAHGPVEAVTDQYETTAKLRKSGATLRPSAKRRTGAKKRSFTQDAAVFSGGLYSLDGARIETLRGDEDSEVRMEIDVATPGAELRFGAALTAGKQDGVRLVQSKWMQVPHAGRYVVSAKLPPGLLGDGYYVGRVGGFVRVDGEETAIALLDAFGVEAYRSDALQGQEEERPDGIQELENVTWRVQVAPPHRQRRGASRDRRSNVTRVRAVEPPGHRDETLSGIPRDPVAKSLRVAIRRTEKALAKAIEAADGGVGEKVLQGPATTAERGTTPLAARVRAERAALPHLRKALHGLDAAVEELHEASLGEAASALARFDATGVPIKHRVRRVEDEAIRHVLLEELRREREREIVELIEARDVRWEAPLRTEPPIGAGMDERVVELPLARQFLEVNRDAWALDAGASLNLPFFRATLGDDSPRLVHLTQSSTREPALFDGDRASYVFGDLRQIPFQKGFFDRVLCISTLEHVGLDNTRYGAAPDDDPGSYVAAVREMGRVLAPGGKLLITVPVGVPRSLKWFQVFGKEALQKMQRILRGVEVEVRFFAYRGSWVDVDAEEALTDQAEGEAVGAVAALAATHPGRPGV